MVGDFPKDILISALGLSSLVVTTKSVPPQPQKYIHTQMYQNEVKNVAGILKTRQIVQNMIVLFDAYQQDNDVRH